LSKLDTDPKDLENRFAYAKWLFEKERLADSVE